MQIDELLLTHGPLFANVPFPLRQIPYLTVATTSKKITGSDLVRSLGFTPKVRMMRWNLCNEIAGVTIRKMPGHSRIRKQWIRKQKEDSLDVLITWSAQEAGSTLVGRIVLLFELRFV